MVAPAQAGFGMKADAPSRLARLIGDLIRLEGPIGLDHYMALASGHPALGYYATRDPFGRGGDFITAPEISQMFGEMIGVWAATVWQAMGSPTLVRLVELGPGRGTLMADFLRAAKSLPAFRAAIDLHLVETSPLLRDRQAAALAPTGVSAQWHDRLDTVPEGPILAIANEFVDALPVRHYQNTERGWCERLVGLGPDDALMFGLAPEPEPRLAPQAPFGAILEVAAEAQALTRKLADRLVTAGGAALIIDYGHTKSGFGETLQAVRGHAYSDPLASPGEADLTTHVDFAALARVAREAGAEPHGPVEQGAFLLELGLAARAEQLGRVHPDRAETVATALQRLTDPGSPHQPGMGRLFKVLALTAPGGPVVPGFETASS